MSIKLSDLHRRTVIITGKKNLRAAMVEIAKALADWSGDKSIATPPIKMSELASKIEEFEGMK